MALQTDDCDIRDVKFYMDLGGNGDYYINLVEYPKADSISSPDKITHLNYRCAMSGGGAPHKVKMAIFRLFQAMEEAGLNEYPRPD